MCGSEGDDGDGRHDEEKEREGGWWKERWKKRGGWRPGVGSRGRVVEAGANEPFFTPVDRWVVERGLPRLLSVSRTSGLQHLRFFLPFVRPLSSSFSVLGFRLSHPFSLVFPSLSLLSCSARSTLATLLFRDLVSAAAFLFFPLSDLYARLPASSLLPLFLPLFLPLPLPPFCRPHPCFAALYARAFPASPALRSNRLRIHCEIDRPKRVPEWPERTRMQQKGMGWHMRSGAI